MTQTPDNREAIARIVREHMPIAWRDEDALRTAAFVDGLADAILATRGDRFAEGVEAAAAEADNYAAAHTLEYVELSKMTAVAADRYCDHAMAARKIAAAIRSLKAPEN